MKLGRTFYFDAAHYLPNYKGKCEKLHGHTYRLDVIIESEIGNDGMILDFNDLKKIVETNVIDKVDHQDLNKIFKNPTAENMTEWIFNRLDKKLPLYSVRLYEGHGKWVEKTK